MLRFVQLTAVITLNLCSSFVAFCSAFRSDCYSACFELRPRAGHGPDWLPELASSQSSGGGLR